MAVEQIYDRKNETEILKGILSGQKNKLLVHGESGSGKSTVILKAIHVEESIHPGYNVAQYEFGDHEKSFANLGLQTYLTDLYRSWTYETRLGDDFRHKRSKQVGWSVGAFKGAISESHEPDREFTATYIEQFLRLASKHIRVLWLSNIERCDHSVDIALIRALLTHPSPFMLIFEIGTLTPDSERLRDELQELGGAEIEALEINQFNKYHSSQLYEFLHQQNAPLNLFLHTHGNSFAISCYKQRDSDWLKNRKFDEHFFQDIGATKLALSLYYLGGCASVDFVTSLFDSVEDFSKAYRHSIDIIEETVSGAELKFRHGLVSVSIENSRVPKIERKNILKTLVGHYGGLPKPNLEETEILFHLLCESECFYDAVQAGLVAVTENFRIQAYGQVIALSSKLMTCFESRTEAAPIYKIATQTALLLGWAEKAELYLQYLEEESQSTTLLVALWKYQRNQFSECISILRKFIISNTVSPLSARAFGIISACHVALDEPCEAMNAISTAQKMAGSSKDSEFYLECIRYLPAVIGFVEANEEFEALKQSHYPDQYPYLWAKCCHNYTTEHLMLDFNDEKMKKLESVLDYFRSNNSPELTYASVSLSAFYLLNREDEKAGTILNDALNYAHEEYDKVCIQVNLAILMHLKGKNKEALKLLERCTSYFESEYPYILSDPHFTHQVYHNLALLYVINKEFFRAREAFARAIIPEKASDYEEKCRRATFISQLIDKRESVVPWKWNEQPNASMFKNQGYTFDVATLQFFDFNVRVIDIDAEVVQAGHSALSAHRRRNQSSKHS